MRKQTKKSLTRKLDREISKQVRSVGSCQKCGCTDHSKLQAAHIFSRANRAVRWDTLNIVCLCARCHFWGHQNPVLFTEFIKNYLGRSKYCALKTRASSIKKWVIPEMQELLDNMVKDNEEMYDLESG